MRLSELLKDTGWGADAEWFASVIGAESGFNPKIKNTTAPCGTRKDGSPAHAVGLTQICTIHLDKGGVAEGLSEDDLLDPRVNLVVARKIFKAQGRGAWEGYTNGGYKQYPSATSLNKDIPIDKGFNITDAIIGALGPMGLPLRGLQAVGGEIPSPGDVADGVVDTVTAIPNAIDSAVGVLTKRETWFTVAKVTFGGALILIGTAGLVFVVAKNVSSATPIGQIRKAIT